MITTLNIFKRALLAYVMVKIIEELTLKMKKFLPFLNVFFGS